MTTTGASSRPSIPLADWQDIRDTLHLYTQVVGKVRLANEPPTHTWDLATATGQPSALPDDVAMAALEVSRATISSEIRPSRFGPEVAAPGGATATDALVALLGRTP